METDGQNNGQGEAQGEVVAVRGFMAVEASVMAACQDCAGSAKMATGGGVECALSEPVDCVLPRLLADLSAPLPDGDGYAKERRIHLLNVASPTWCLQHKQNTDAVPA